MKLSRGPRRDNLFNSFFSVSQRHSFNLYEIVYICANKLSLSLSLGISQIGYTSNLTLMVGYSNSHLQAILIIL